MGNNEVSDNAQIRHQNLTEEPLVSRRTFLTGTALAVAAPGLSALPATAAAVTSLPLDLVNRRAGQQVYAHVFGWDRPTARWFFLGADGKTRVFPPSATSAMTPLTTNTAIPLGAVGTTKRVTLTPMDSGRIFFAVGKPLKFFVNPGGGVALPSVTNPADANADVEWGFFELSLDGNGAFGNISFVDFVGVRIGLTLFTATGRQDVGGLVSGGLDQVISGLRTQSATDNAGWGDLIVAKAGKSLRVLSPNMAAHSPAWTGRLNNYLDPYINQVWQKYRSTDLRIDTQSSLGTVVGRVGADGLLRFPGIGTFSKPSSFAVFNCSVAPFVTTNDAMGNLTARLTAAFNRGTLLANPIQPDASATQFYRAPVTNHYARLVHAATAGGDGYAFPYDDVHTAGYNAEGSVVDGKPTRLVVSVG
jgi:hypothetical protein